MLLVVGMVSQAFAGPVPAFERLKSLQGKWAIQADGKTLPIQMTYEIGSKGSIVTEQFGKELSVFFIDGGKPQMIHFCNAGNQPRLQLKESARPDVLEFETFAVSGAENAETDHVQRIIYRMISDRKLELEIVWQKGKMQESEKYSLEKI